MTKAQKVKVIAGYNFERETGQSQYKYRNGTFNMEGGDTARRLNLLATLVTGLPITVFEATLENFNDVVEMQSDVDEFFAMHTRSVEEQTAHGKKLLEKWSK